MPPLLIAYPMIDPVLVNLGPLPVRWYALGYIGALLLGWAGARAITGNDQLWGGRAHASVPSMDDLVVYMAAGIILGGRLGYILFYNLPFYLANPLEALVVWKGGMAFHGGLLGSIVAMALFARREKLPVLGVSDMVSPVVPIGIVLVRLANFIKPELWGRATDVPWAMIFPGSDGQPRHPSQLYEAGLEGAVLLIVLSLAVRFGALRREGLITGLFCSGYGLARITCEFFREPDPQLGFLFGGATMGMLLSLPLVLFGAFLMIRALRKPVPVPAPA